MTEKPMLFSDEMIRAILADKKTQTRRVVKHPDGCLTGDCPHEFETECKVAMEDAAQWKKGDRIWVREAWQVPEYEDRKPSDIPESAHIVYRADYTDPYDPAAEFRKWRPSIHMPRCFSRITLEVTGVRIERLDEISEADAIAEGIHKFAGIDLFGFNPKGTPGPLVGGSAKEAFALLWESIYGPGSFDERWVLVIEFKKTEC